MTLPPTTQRALVLTDKHGVFVVTHVPVPHPGPGELLIKIHASALNSLDIKVQEYGVFVTHYPAVLGMDIAGTVETLGEGVVGFEKGDRVIVESYYENSHAGFQQYTLARADLVAKIPSNISFEQAATLPVGLLTAALGLFTQNLPLDAAHEGAGPFGSAGLFPPWDAGGRGKYAGKPFLVLGASGSVGQYVVQLAKLAGFSPIIATASPHNAPLLLSLGATHFLDRHLSTSSLRAEIAKITSAPFEVIFDAVSFPQTQQEAYDILAPGGTLVLVLPPKIKVKPEEQKRVVKVFASAYVCEQNRALTSSLFKALPGLLEEETIKPNPVDLVPGGLGAIADALVRFTNNKVSGVKLVVRPQETQ
ncbi:GroES-like protein [Laetiporus sulphureus 93-53]|uniref:GroES-like protein n=1 Tax=Laetiporus sulphureus 93-53 TaxID=1314785 RepID=A0A165BFB4_9APHY|nr:GroES-like protein [Laetiporus sulphureus 93-53]KZT00934.1 GroES-like protein [Laetiporus sulphureus 93-53]